MRASLLITALALAFSSAAMAQQSRDQTATTENAGTTAKPADDGQRVRGAMHRLGNKTRHAMHRADDKLHAKGDRHHNAHERHARADERRAERRADLRDTRAMGADRADMRDSDGSRRTRMDDAYANWKARHDKS